MNACSKNLRSPRTLLGQLRSGARAVSDAFAWPLRTTDYLELVNPLWNSDALKARVESVQNETIDTRTLRLRPGSSYRRHRAGQFVRVAVPIDGRHYTRTYSISSAPETDQECFSISIKAVPGGRVSQHLVRQIKPGDYLSISAPQGDFVLPDSAPIKPLFITAGSGITPVMSMLRSLLARDRLRDVVHLHYAPRADQVIFGSELAELADSQPRYALELLLTRAGVDPQRHFSGQQLAQLCPDWRSRDVYACGPETLLSAVEDHYRMAGLASRVHSERFRAPSATLPSCVTGGRVLFSRSAKEARSNGVTNLLQLAEDNGLNPVHGCRMGICHSCDVVLKSGCVRDLRTNTLINEAGQTVQICVSAAVGDAEIDL